MARPKSDNAKEHRLGFRVNNEDYDRLKEYSTRHEQSITDSILEAIKLLYEKENSNRN